MIDFSPKVLGLRERLQAFMEAHIYPNERRFYTAIDLAGARHQGELVAKTAAKLFG